MSHTHLANKCGHSYRCASNAAYGECIEETMDYCQAKFCDGIRKTTMTTTEPRNHEDISVILGRIRTFAEAIATRSERVSNHTDVVLSDISDAFDIQILVEQALSSIIHQQWGDSLKAVQR